MLGEPSGTHQELPDELTEESVEVEYVGSPTEFAEAEEVPGWLANVAKAIAAIPIAVGAVVGLQMLSALLLVLCLILVAMTFLVF